MLRRNPPKQLTLLRSSSYGGSVQRIHPPAHARGLLRRRINGNRLAGGSATLISAEEFGKGIKMIPSRQAFTSQEWKIICRHRTPYQVQRFLNALPYNNEESKQSMRTFRGVIADRSAHCLEAALSATVILEQYGYPALLLDLESQDNLDHVLFLYRKYGKWGTVARSRDPGLQGRRPVFGTIRELVDSYADPYVDFSGRIVGFGVCDLTDLGKYDWRLSEKNVWQVERFLIAMPHRRFHTTNQRYRYWYERYLAYRRRYGGRKPVYYPNRRCWTLGYPKPSETTDGRMNSAR